MIHPRRISAAVLLTVLSALAAGAQTPPPGHTRSLAVAQVQEAPIVDGILDDRAWAGVPRASGFWVSDHGRAPREETEVRVVADGQSLYFAFKCDDSRPRDIFAQQTRRDADPALDDRVIVELDPYHNHRLLYYFTVNALGTQGDRVVGGRANKIEWKGDWNAAVHRTGNGWTAELEVPFGMLDYASGATTFGVNFVRFQHRTQEWSRWADITPRQLPEEAGHLTGLVVPPAAQASRFTMLQYAAGGLNTPDTRGEIQDHVISTGFDLRADPTRNLKIVASVNPDFSQIEDDVLGLSFDYNEKIRRDHRPFFQEGEGYFPRRLYFYSGRVPLFGMGAKTFGRVGRYQIGALGTIEGIEGRRDYAATLRRELGSTLDMSVHAVGTRQDEFDNALAAAEITGRVLGRVTIGAEAAGTTTSVVGDGARLAGRLGYQGEHWYVGGAVDKVETRFFPANGFIAGDLISTRGANAVVGHAREYAGSWFRRSNASVSYDWRDTLNDLVQRRSLSAYGSGELRGNLVFGGGVTRGPYRPRIGGPGVWGDSMNDDELFSTSFSHYASNNRYGGGVGYSWGTLDNGRYANLTPSIWVKPVPRAFVQYSYDRVDYFGLSQQHILSGSWDLTTTQAVSARWVRYGENYYRLVYRRIVRRGVDLYAIYDSDPFGPDRFTFKAVWTLLGDSRTW